MADDIYPLGQDRGLIPDIINFGLNNLYQYGQKTGETNRQTSQVFSDLQAGKNPDLGPLTGDILSTSPLYTGVINWAGMTDPAKAMLQKFGQRYPKMIGAAEAMPAVLEASINPLEEGVAGALSKPLPSAHFMELSPEYSSNLSTIGHELQHSLNAPRVAGTNPLDALTIGTLLQDILPPNRRGSLDTVLGKQIQEISPLRRLATSLGFASPPTSLVLQNPDRNLMRSAMDEGLAYLGQNAAEGRGGDLVKTLADRLGVNWENPRVTEGLGETGSKLASMAKRTEPASMYERLPRAGRSFQSAEDIARGQAGETLPALGSAMPDIPRPVSSPGALEHFEALRQRLGLPAADLGGAAPEFYGKPIPPPSIPGDPKLYSQRGGKALDEIYQNWTDPYRTNTMLQGKQVEPIQAMKERYSKDDFMKDVISHLSWATQPRLRPGVQTDPSGLWSRGLKGFREDLRLKTPNEPYNKIGKLPPEMTLDVLEQLKEHGLLEQDAIERALSGHTHGIPTSNPKGLDYLKRLLERVGR